MILRQKIIFFPIAEGGANIFRVFRVKNHDFTPKIIFFPILGPPVSAPGNTLQVSDGYLITF
jgi:hypothetical protein